MEFMFGSDPEFMLERGGNYYSAVEIIPGTKLHRFAIGKHSVYYDNVMAECAILPGKNKRQTIANIRDCLQRVTTLVKPYRLVARASQEFPKDQLQSPEAKEIGCNPEYCAYRLSEVEPPEEAFQAGTLRSAGGHVHIGSTLAHDPFDCISIVRMLDLFLGTASIFIDKDRTTKKRKELYGQAGRFRQPAHGVEYRSLGNFWLSSPELVSFVYDVCKFTLEFVEKRRHEEFWTIDHARLDDDDAWNEEGFHPSQCHHCHGYNIDSLRMAIDTMDKRRGKKFLEFIFTLMPRKLYDKLLSLSEEKPFDLYEQWKLK